MRKVKVLKVFKVVKDFKEPFIGRFRRLPPT